MSRLTAIFNTVFLSLLIIMVGSGLTLVHCTHTDNVAVAQLSTMGIGGERATMMTSGECCSKRNDCCCGCCNSKRMKAMEKAGHHCDMSSRSCMSLSSIGIQPLSSHEAPRLSFQQTAIVMHSALTAVMPQPTYAYRLSPHAEGHPEKAPPRHYLRLLTILLI